MFCTNNVKYVKYSLYNILYKLYFDKLYFYLSYYDSEINNCKYYSGGKFVLYYIIYIILYMSNINKY
jgi:hypothetical protein